MRQKLLIITLIIASFITQAQTLEELEAELALLESELDSLGVMDLMDLEFLDSLLSLEEKETELNIGFGYSSQVVTAGQTLGIDQYGLTPSLSFYHKSGLFADYTGFFNSDADPQYFLHNASVGYMGTLGKSWSYSASYMKQFYEETSNPLEHSFNFSGTYSLKKFSASLAYSRYFGEQSSNLLMPSVSMFINKPDFLFLKSISIFPIVSLSYANPNLLYASFTERYIKGVWLQESTVNLTDTEVFFLFSTNIPERIANRYYDGRRLKMAGALLESVDFTENTRFGLTSTAFSLPVIMEFNERFTVTLSYTYIIPERLFLGTISEFKEPIPTLAAQFDRFGQVVSTIDETSKTIAFDIENMGYFGINLSYSIPFKSKGK